MKAWLASYREALNLVEIQAAQEATTRPEKNKIPGTIKQHLHFSRAFGDMWSGMKGII